MDPVDDLKIIPCELTAFFYQIKKEETLGDGVPMETSSTTAGEDKKPELKTEFKEQEEGSGSTVTHSSPSGVPNKKKSMIRLHLGILAARVGFSTKPTAGSLIMILLNKNIIGNNLTAMQHI